MSGQRKKPTLQTPAFNVVSDNPTVIIPANKPTPFQIKKLNRVFYGSKTAEFVIAIDGLGTLNLDLFEPTGKPPFVTPASVKDEYSSTWKRTFYLDPSFAADVLATVLDGLNENARPAPKPRAQSNVKRFPSRSSADDASFYESREAAFEEAVKRLDGAA